VIAYYRSFGSIDIVTAICVDAFAVYLLNVYTALYRQLSSSAPRELRRALLFIAISDHVVMMVLGMVSAFTNLAYFTAYKSFYFCGICFILFPLSLIVFFRLRRTVNDFLKTRPTTQLKSTISYINNGGASRVMEMVNKDTIMYYPPTPMNNLANGSPANRLTFAADVVTPSATKASTPSPVMAATTPTALALTIPTTSNSTGGSGPSNHPSPVAVNVGTVMNLMVTSRDDVPVTTAAAAALSLASVSGVPSTSNRVNKRATMTAWDTSMLKVNTNNDIINNGNNNNDTNGTLSTRRLPGTLSVSPRAMTTHRTLASQGSGRRLRTEKESAALTTTDDGVQVRDVDGSPSPRMTTIPPSTSASRLPALPPPVIPLPPPSPLPQQTAIQAAVASPEEKRRQSLRQSMIRLSILTVIMDLVIIAILAILAGNNIAILTDEKKSNGPPVIADPLIWQPMDNAIVYVQWLTIFVMIW
jgi:hypothetical protein